MVSNCAKLILAIFDELSFFRRFSRQNHPSVLNFRPKTLLDDRLSFFSRYCTQNLEDNLPTSELREWVDICKLGGLHIRFESAFLYMEIFEIS